MQYEPWAIIDDGKPVGAMLRAYLECAEWCGLDDDEREAFELAVKPKWTAESIAAARADCDAFAADNASLIESIGADDGEIGRSFWLSRNGHGSGFFDRGWGAAGDALQRNARVYGESHVSFDPSTETLHLI